MLKWLRNGRGPGAGGWTTGLWLLIGRIQLDAPVSPLPTLPATFPRSYGMSLQLEAFKGGPGGLLGQNGLGRKEGG